MKRRRQNEFVVVVDDEEVQLRHPLKANNAANASAAAAADVEFKFRIDFSDASDSMCKRWFLVLYLA